MPVCARLEMRLEASFQPEKTALKFMENSTDASDFSKKMPLRGLGKTLRVAGREKVHFQ